MGTWDDWLRHFDVSEEEWNDGAALNDPEGVLPAVSFIKVPEGKTAKNRVHLDLQVSGGRHLPRGYPDRADRVDGGAADRGGRDQPRALRPARRVARPLMMADPEGNEFCVV